MGFNLGDVFPDFKALASNYDGEFELYEYLGDSWGILLSHPNDFTPVCTTELGKAAKMADEFSRKNCKLVGLSCNDVESHEGWCKDILCYSQLSNKSFPFPMIADKDRTLSTRLGIMDPDEKDKDGIPLTCRCVFFISPEKKVCASVLYPATTGRSMEELLRVLDSLQLTKRYPVATPEGWKKGDRVMVVPTLSDEDATSAFPKKYETISLPSQKNYLRLTPDPRL